MPNVIMYKEYDKIEKYEYGENFYLTKKGNNYGLLDSNKREIFPCNYKKGFLIIDDKFIIMTEENNLDGLYDLEKRKIIFDCEYKCIQDLHNQRHGYVFLCDTIDGNLEIYNAKKGEIVYSKKAEEDDEYYEESGLFLNVRENKKKTYTDIYNFSGDLIESDLELVHKHGHNNYFTLEKKDFCNILCGETEEYIFDGSINKEDMLCVGDLMIAKNQKIIQLYDRKTKMTRIFYGSYYIKYVSNNSYVLIDNENENNTTLLDGIDELIGSFKLIKVIEVKNQKKVVLLAKIDNKKTLIDPSNGEIILKEGDEVLNSISDTFAICKNKNNEEYLFNYSSGKESILKSGVKGYESASYTHSIILCGDGWYLYNVVTGEMEIKNPLFRIEKLNVKDANIFLCTKRDEDNTLKYFIYDANKKEQIYDDALHLELLKNKIFIANKEKKITKQLVTMAPSERIENQKNGVSSVWEISEDINNSFEIGDVITGEILHDNVSEVICFMVNYILIKIDNMYKIVSLKTGETVLENFTNYCIDENLKLVVYDENNVFEVFDPNILTEKNSYDYVTVSISNEDIKADKYLEVNGIYFENIKAYQRYKREKK